MKAISKLIGMLSSVFLLCWGVFYAIQHIKAAQSAGQEGRSMEIATLVEQLMGLRMIQGDVVQIVNAYYLLRDQDGKNVQMHTNKKTKITGDINPGARVEAQVNRNNLAVKISLMAIHE